MTEPRILIDRIDATKVLVANSVETVNIAAPIAPRLRDSLDRIAAGTSGPDDLLTLERALVAGGGDGRLSFGDVSLTVARAGTVNQETIVYQGPQAGAVAEALDRIQREVSSDTEKRLRQAYANAIRRHGLSFPYLLPQLLSADRLEAVYVPLSAYDQNDLRSDMDIGFRGTPVVPAEIMVATAVQATGPVVLVSGPPGAGKSTLLRRLCGLAWDGASDLGLDRPHLAMPLKLRHLAAAEGATIGSRLWQALALGREVQVQGAAPSDGYFEDWSAQADAPWLLLLDAMDEVPDARRRDLCNWLSELSDALPGLRMIISARTAEALAGTRLQGVREIALSPLDGCQFRAITHAWLGDDRAARLEQDAQYKGLKGLLDVPLTATIAAMILRQKGELPPSRSQLFEQIAAIAVDEARRQGIDDRLSKLMPTISAGALPLMLDYLALASLEDPDSSLDDEAACASLCRFLSQAAPGVGHDLLKAAAVAMLDLLEDLSGVLRPGAGLNWVHAEIRDFLAARALVRRAGEDTPPLLAVIERWKDPAWTGVLLALFGVLGRRRTGAPLEAMMRAILDQVDGEAGNSARLLAGEALAEVGSISDGIDQEVLDTLMQAEGGLTYYGMCNRLLSPRNILDVVDRFRTRPALLSRMRPFVDNLISDTQAGDPEMVKHATRTLCWLGELDGIDRLIEAPDIDSVSVLEGIASFDLSLPADRVDAIVSRIIAMDKQAIDNSSKNGLSWTDAGALVAMLDNVPMSAINDPEAPILFQLLAAFNYGVQDGADQAAARRRISELTRGLKGVDSGKGLHTPVEQPDAYAFLLSWLPAEALLDASRGTPDLIRHHVRWCIRDPKAPAGRVALINYATPLMYADFNAKEIRKKRIIAAVTAAAAHGSLDPWFDRVRNSGDDTDLASAIACGFARNEVALARFASDRTIALAIRIEAIEAGQSFCGSDRFADILQSVLPHVAQALASETADTALAARHVDWLEELGDRDGALAAAERWVALDPDAVAAIARRGQCRSAVGAFEDAADDFEAVLNQAPADTNPDFIAEAWLGLAGARREAGFNATAFAAADEAIRLGLETPGFYAERALALQGQGFYAEALDDFLCADALEGWEVPALNPWVYEQAAICALNCNDLTAAVRFLGDERLGYEVGISAHYCRAEVCLRQGDIDGAPAATKAALLLEPDSQWCRIFEALIADRACRPYEFISVPGDPNQDPILPIWQAAIANDEAAAYAAVAFVNRNENKQSLRDAGFHTRRIAALLDLPWLPGLQKHVSDLIDAANQGPAPPRGLPPVLTDAKSEFVEPALVAPPKPRLPHNMLCHAFGIEGFDEEKERADLALEAWVGTRGVMIYGLEDGDHLYLQANFIAPELIDETEFIPMNVKLLIPYERGTREEVLPRILADWQPDWLLFEEKRLMARFSKEPAYAKFAGRFRLASDLPSEGELIEKPPGLKGFFARLFS